MDAIVVSIALAIAFVVDSAAYSNRKPPTSGRSRSDRIETMARSVFPGLHKLLDGQPDPAPTPTKRFGDGSLTKIDSIRRCRSSVSLEDGFCVAFGLGQIFCPEGVLHESENCRDVGVCCVMPKPKQYRSPNGGPPKARAVPPSRIRPVSDRYRVALVIPTPIGGTVAVRPTTLTNTRFPTGAVTRFQQTVTDTRVQTETVSSVTTLTGEC